MDHHDFLSLKLSTSAVEEAAKDGGGAKDSVNLRGSGMQWPLSSKVFALPQFMPYKNIQEDRGKKMAPEHHASSAYVRDPTADPLDTTHKTLNSFVQPNSFSIDRQGGVHYPIAAVPVQHVGPHWTNRAPDNGMLYANNPFFNNTHISTSRSNFTPTMKQQPFGGTLNTTQHSNFANAGSWSGIADQRNVTKPLGASTQMTIFYGGSVCVYDDISPEKAQAIMHLAGKGSSTNPNMISPKTQMQEYDSKVVGAGGSYGNQSITMSLGNLKDTSQANAQSMSGSSGTAESTAVPNSTFPSGSFPPPMAGSGVPQARKASLARFLEKRKERAMSALPYNINSKFPDSNAAPGPKGLT